MRQKESMDGEKAERERERERIPSKLWTVSAQPVTELELMS